MHKVLVLILQRLSLLFKVRKNHQHFLSKTIILKDQIQVKKLLPRKTVKRQIQGLVKLIKIHQTSIFKLSRHTKMSIEKFNQITEEKRAKKFWFCLMMIRHPIQLGILVLLNPATSHRVFSLLTCQKLHLLNLFKLQSKLWKVEM